MALSRITHLSARILITTLFAIFSAGATLAQDTQPSFKFTLFSVEGLVISDNYTIDADFSQTHGAAVGAPFKFQLPRQDNMTPLFEPGDGSDGMALKINYTTGDKDTEIADRQLIENIRFVNMTLPLGEIAERLEVLAKLLANDGYNSAIAGYEQHEYIGTRETKIGEYDAVEVFGKYVEPGLGLMYVRLVGIPNPNSENSIFAVSNTVDSKFDLQSLDDLALTGTGKTLSSFEYITE